MSSIVIQGDTSGSITVEAPSVAGTHTLTLPKATGNIATDATVGLGMKNRVINGNMVIDQRNAGSAKTIGNGSTNTNYIDYTLDRWQAQSYTSGSGTGGFEFTVQQVSDAPDNFTSSAKITVTTAKASLGAQDVGRFQQPIEGYNFADIGWGTSAAKDITISFWVKSSLTGTFGASVSSGSGTIHSYPFTYTILSANTWEKKTITIAGYTSGTWLTTNGKGLNLCFSLGSGSDWINTAFSWTTGTMLGATGETSVVGTSGATWQITGVQLEVGENATPFENRMYGTELALCQRYYERSSSANAFHYYSVSDTSNNFVFNTLFRVIKRATPTMYWSSVLNNRSGSWNYTRAGVAWTSSSTTNYGTDTEHGGFYMGVGAAATAVMTNGWWEADCEI